MLIKMDELIKQVVKVEDRRIIKEINDIKCVDIEYRDEFELARSAIIELLTHTDLKGVKNEH